MIKNKRVYILRNIKKIKMDQWQVEWTDDPMDTGFIPTNMELAIKITLLHLGLHMNEKELHGFKFVVISAKKTFTNFKTTRARPCDKGTCNCVEFCLGIHWRQKFYGTPYFPSISHNVKLPREIYIEGNKMRQYDSQWVNKKKELC